MREEQKKVIQKEMDRLKHLGIIRKGLTDYSSLVVLVKQKNQNLYQVCSDFRILNEKLVKINHAFPLVRDCIEQLGRKKCHYLSTIDLRDACKQNFDVIMDDKFIHSTADKHMDDLMDLFKVLRKYGLKISPHKCQFFKKKS